MTPYQQMFCILDYRIVSYFTEACIELGVFDHLTQRSLPIPELAKRTGTHERALYRCLRGLVHFGLFREQEDRVFSLTETSHYITTGSEFSLRPWNTFCQSAQSSQHRKRRQLWKQLLCTGKSIYQIGRNQLFYDYLREHQDIASAFDKGMESMSQVEIKEVLQGVDFSASDDITEVAGGNGALITGILQKYRNIKGHLCDFPDVVKRVSGTERLTISGVNMHQSLPAISGDVIVKRILHSYSDEQGSNILKNIRKVTRPGSKLYIFELVEDTAVLNPYVGIKNLQMLLVHGVPGEHGGPGERTEQEFASLLHASGFELVRVEKLPSIDAIVAVSK